MKKINEIIKIFKTPGAFASVKDVDIFFEKSLWEIYEQGQKDQNKKIKALFKTPLKEYKKLLDVDFDLNLKKHLDKVKKLQKMGVKLPKNRSEVLDLYLDLAKKGYFDRNKVFNFNKEKKLLQATVDLLSCYILETKQDTNNNWHYLQIPYQNKISGKQSKILFGDLVSIPTKSRLANTKNIKTIKK